MTAEYIPPDMGVRGMKREWQTEQILELEDGRRLSLDYWLLTDQTCWGESFGIAITDSTGAEEAIRHITTHRDEAEHLLRLLAGGGVTPVTAEDIVSDYLNALYRPSC